MYKLEEHDTTMGIFFGVSTSLHTYALLSSLTLAAGNSPGPRAGPFVRQPHHHHICVLVRNTAHPRRIRCACIFLCVALPPRDKPPRHGWARLAARAHVLYCKPVIQFYGAAILQ